MSRKQWFVVGFACLFLIVLGFFGKRTSSSKVDMPIVDSNAVLTTEQIITSAKNELNENQLQVLTALENSVVRGNVQEQQINTYKQISRLWIDSFHRPDLANYYRGEAAKLEKSEKNLSFAALFFLEDLLIEQNPARQKWLAEEAQTLFEQGLELNPDNDSLKVGLGACYLFGGTSSTPMQGVSLIKGVADKNPDNLFARMMLGLGNIKNGQLDKAVEYFQYILSREPDNLEAAFNMAETFERKGDKVNAIKWYKTIRDKIEVPEAKKELDNRISSLEN